MHFTHKEIPSLAGKTILITGANSGLGLESAKALAGAGARVIVACRSLHKAEQARALIRAERSDALVDTLALDLACLSSVRSAVREVEARYPELDVLLNNAGVMAVPQARTQDGFELQFGTNHLGHFALTGLLFALLSKTPGARVVNVSSSAHKMGKIRFDDPHWEHGYKRWHAYGMSKLANLLFTYELARRCSIAGVSLLSVAAHPGYAATNLQYRGFELDGARIAERLTRAINPLLGQPAKLAALPQICAAVSPEITSGDYIGPGGLFEVRGNPKKVQSNARSHDTADQRKLWELSERLTNVGFGLL